MRRRKKEQEYLLNIQLGYEYTDEVKKKLTVVSKNIMARQRRRNAEFNTNSK